MYFLDWSTVIQCTPRLLVGAPRLVVRASRLVVGIPRLVVGALRLVADAPRCSQAGGRHSQTCYQCSKVLPGAPEGHCISPVNSGIWPPLDSGLTALRHSQRLPVTKIHCADVPLISHIRLYPPYHCHLSPPYFFLVHNITIIAEHKVKSSISIPPCHDHELTLFAAYTKYSIHQIQHTPNTAYTKYSIHQIQHMPNTAYTKYSIHQIQHTPNTVYTPSSIHRLQHPLTIVCVPFIPRIMSYPLNVASAVGVPLHEIDCHQPALYESSKVNLLVTLSRLRLTVTNWWIEF